MLDNLWPYIGMGMLAITVALFYYLATHDGKRQHKKSSLKLPPEHNH